MTLPETNNNDHTRSILVIGNGFDLFHGMKTSYNDFIAFIKSIIEDVTILQDESVPIGIQEKLKEAPSNNFVDYFIAYTEAIDSWVDLKILIKEMICFQNILQEQ